MKKILYVTTISNTVNAFLVPHIEMLVSKGHQVDVAFNIEQKVDKRIIELGCIVHEVSFQRNPLSFDNIKAYKEIKKLVEEENYDIVHTHTPVASTIVRLACKRLRKVKVIYTAHGFHFFDGAPLKNWLIFYPIEKFLSRYTDTIITINKEDYKIASTEFKSKNIEYIKGVGLNLNRFREYKVSKKKKRTELNIPENAFVILSIGEINRNKNHKVIISAVSKLEKLNIHYVICGKGCFRNKLEKQINKLNLEKRIHLLGYRQDIAEICKAADVFAFPSRREGLGIAALEAMASGLPIITSNIHGIMEYSEHGKTGFNCSPNNIECFKKSIYELYHNRHLIDKMGSYNQEKVNQFEVAKVINQIIGVYN